MNSILFLPLRDFSTCNNTTPSFTRIWIELLFQNHGKNSYHHKREPLLENVNFKTRLALMLEEVSFKMPLIAKGSTISRSNSSKQF